MADLTRRIHVLLTEDQVEFLKEVSQREGRPMGDLLRSAFEAKYKPASPIEALQALDRLEVYDEPTIGGANGAALYSKLRPGFAIPSMMGRAPAQMQDQPVFLGAMALACLCRNDSQRSLLIRQLRTLLKGGGRLLTSAESLRQMYGALLDLAGFPVLRRVRPLLEAVFDDVAELESRDLAQAADLMELYGMGRDDAFELAPALRISVPRIVSPSIGKAPPGVSIIFSEAFLPPI